MCQLSCQIFQIKRGLGNNRFREVWDTFVSIKTIKHLFIVMLVTCLVLEDKENEII